MILGPNTLITIRVFGFFAALVSLVLGFAYVGEITKERGCTNRRVAIAVTAAVLATCLFAGVSVAASARLDALNENDRKVIVR